MNTCHSPHHCRRSTQQILETGDGDGLWNIKEGRPIPLLDPCGRLRLGSGGPPPHMPGLLRGA
jgi:hypothetical protein